MASLTLDGLSPEVDELDDGLKAALKASLDTAKGEERVRKLQPFDLDDEEIFALSRSTFRGDELLRQQENNDLEEALAISKSGNDWHSWQLSDADEDLSLALAASLEFESLNEEIELTFSDPVLVRRKAKGKEKASPSYYKK